MVFLLVQNLLELIDFFFRRGPTGNESADGVMVVGLTEMGESNLLAEKISLFVSDDNKLLVGRGVDQKLEPLFLENILHPHGHLDGMFREMEVKLVGEQSFKLQADKGTFRNDGTVLFLDGEEVLMSLTIGKDHCLATEGADFRTADIEHVAVAGEIG